MELTQWLEYVQICCGAGCHADIHSLHSTLFSQAVVGAGDLHTEQPRGPIPSIHDIQACPPTLHLVRSEWGMAGDLHQFHTSPAVNAQGSAANCMTLHQMDVLLVCSAALYRLVRILQQLQPQHQLLLKMPVKAVH